MANANSKLNSLSDRGSKFRSRWLGSNQVALALFVVGAAWIQTGNRGTNCVACAVATSLQESGDTKLKLVRAREKVATTRKTYTRLKRLSKQGSVSQQEVRTADMLQKIALLEYSSLLDPSRFDQNEVLKAEVIFQYRDREFAVTKELYRSGSVSKLIYNRKLAARDIAASNLKRAKSTSETQRKFQAIQVAKSKFEVAEKEYTMARNLFEKNSISKQTMDRAASNLKLALAELESTKSMLGASATRVMQ